MRGTAPQAVLVLATLLAGLPACNGNFPCGESSEVLLRADGGIYPCLLPSDCPRPGNAIVCATTPNPLLQECVRCEQSSGADGGDVSVCVHVFPRACR